MKPAPVRRLKLAVRGAVQGVGFRPFIYRLANELALTGWVNNSASGVHIEIEGAPDRLEKFRARLQTDKPPRSFIQSCEATWLDPAGFEGFAIRDSEAGGVKTALVMPDLGTCPDCRREIFDPNNRRYRYPFTNCTNCGPRFSIITSLPYDRANTSMRTFAMCPACQAEYDDPNDRRFHAQPNACPDCGPQLELWPGTALPLPTNLVAADVSPLHLLPGRSQSRLTSAATVQGNEAQIVTVGRILSPSDGEREATGTSPEAPRRLAHGTDALLAAAHIIRCGQIVAVKGIGGFHLFADARNESAVQRLRDRKHREEKPFALLFPTLESAQHACEVSPLEARLLQSPEAPIVLLRKHKLPHTALASAIAPGNPHLGVMLPSNPLHHMLLAELGFPVVATSGNLSDEPICTDEFEALERLHGIADAFLVHNRPIVRHADDSIVRVMLDREMVLRRARGYAPLPIHVPGAAGGGHNILAVGGHLKNTVALAVGDQVFLSQHLGDLETEPAHLAFRRACEDLPRLYAAAPEIVAADLHPDYLSTQFALERVAPTGSLRSIRVQHHIAHVLSCLAENEVELPALGVAWDGTGLGTDGTIWGGEFFRVTKDAVERVAHFRPFRLPGGDAAAKEPRRAALGLLYELYGESLFAHQELATVATLAPLECSAFKGMIGRRLNTPQCCSVGRLFDVVASLVNLRQKTRFEGQAAMELEFAAATADTEAGYELELVAGNAGTQVIDWAPMIEDILVDVAAGVCKGEIAAKFHNTLAEVIVTVARRIGCGRVALSGGCFQNRYLTERAVHRLRTDGFQPYWHQRVPPNDGGIALGQVIAAQRQFHPAAADARPVPASSPEISTDTSRLLQTTN